MGTQDPGGLGRDGRQSHSGTVLCELTPLGGPPQLGWSQDALQSVLSSREAPGPLLDSATLSHSAISERGLEAIQVPSCLASWLWFTKSCLGKEGRGRGVLAGAFPWVGLLVTWGLSLRALLLPRKILPGLLGGPGRRFPFCQGVGRRWPSEAGSFLLCLGFSSCGGQNGARRAPVASSSLFPPPTF